MAWSVVEDEELVEGLESYSPCALKTLRSHLTSLSLWLLLSQMGIISERTLLQGCFSYVSTYEKMYRSPSHHACHRSGISVSGGIMKMPTAYTVLCSQMTTNLEVADLVQQGPSCPKHKDLS